MLTMLILFYQCLKKDFQEKYIKLDFSENLALRPKHEAPSAHFSGKQHILHCAIFFPGDIIFHYHLSDDTKHDPVFVDEVLRDLVRQYDMKNEDVMIQSYKAPKQYKNRHPFCSPSEPSKLIQFENYSHIWCSWSRKRYH